jgi:2-C-methyl-D-erythritol 2,4-cyclodiphosphate synthase
MDRFDMATSGLRIGIGYDIHPLVPGVPLILGGSRIEYGKGLSGHSDADVLVHALCDALLGALSLGDLGMHFPETAEFENISSMKLLERVVEMVTANGYRLVNADCIIHAEAPKLSPYRETMAGNISAVIGVEPRLISIKATRGEGLGPVGEGRAIAARAVVLLEMIP